MAVPEPAVRAPAWGPGPAVLVCGFGALWAFWTFGSHPPELPGLFAFPSATWGDGVLLPAQALALTRLARPLPPVRRSWILNAATLLGMVSGGVVVAGALLDPAPPLDWTLPHPHQLAAAGVWHACFLVAAAALFTRLWARLLLGLHRARRAAAAVARDRAWAGWLATAVCAGAGYAVLAVHDGFRSASAPADLSYLIVLGLAAGALSGGLVLVLGRRLRRGATAAVEGVGGAGAVVAVVLCPFPAALAPALALALRGGVVLVALLPHTSRLSYPGRPQAALHPAASSCVRNP